MRKNAAMARKVSKTSPLGDRTQRLPSGKESFHAKGHDISPIQQCSPWYPCLPNKLSIAIKLDKLSHEMTICHISYPGEGSGPRSGVSLIPIAAPLAPEVYVHTGQTLGPWWH